MFENVTLAGNPGLLARVTLSVSPAIPPAISPAISPNADWGKLTT